jgi:hypothetical protein
MCPGHHRTGARWVGFYRIATRTSEELRVNRLERGFRSGTEQGECCRYPWRCSSAGKEDSIFILGTVVEGFTIASEIQKVNPEIVCW